MYKFEDRALIGSERSVGPGPVMIRLAMFLPLLSIVIALQILHLPQNLDYSAFAFGEPGVNLNVVYLVRHGLRPGIDFAHHYGLLGIFLLDGWFRLLGLTPIAYASFIALIHVAMAAVIAEFSASAKLSIPAKVLILVSCPIFLWVNYFNAAHAIELLCLLVAISAHLKGRYAIALAAIGVAVLARPGLGYVYGAILLSIVLLKLIRGHALKLAVLALPSITFLGLAAVLAWRFGLQSLLQTITPRAGAASYKVTGYGFFAKGMAFWWPQPFSIRFYLDTPGFWLLVVAAVIFLGPIALFRATNTQPADLTERKAEILAATAALLFVWVFVAFGHQYIGSWILYLALAVLAFCLLDDFFPMARVMLVVLLLIALNSDRHQLQASLHEWSGVRRSSLFRHTLSSKNEDAQVQDIFNFLDGHKTAVLTYSGAVTLMHSGLGVPESEWFFPGFSRPSEIQRVKSDVAAADLVFVPTPPWHSSDDLVLYWPAYLDPAFRYKIVFQNPMGLVLARAGLK